MKKDSGFTQDLKPEIVKDLGFNNIVSKMVQLQSDSNLVIEFDKSISDKRSKSATKKSSDKFQTSIVKDAIRLEYAFKRENYKKEMRQPSLRKANISDKKTPQVVINDEKGENIKLCQMTTKKGKKCTNRCLGSSSYCGILSHQMSGVKND